MSTSARLQDCLLCGVQHLPGLITQPCYSTCAAVLALACKLWFASVVGATVLNIKQHHEGLVGSCYTDVAISRKTANRRASYLVYTNYRQQQLFASGTIAAASLLHHALAITASCRGIACCESCHSCLMSMSCNRLALMSALSSSDLQPVYSLKY